MLTVCDFSDAKVVQVMPCQFLCLPGTLQLVIERLTLLAAYLQINMQSLHAQHGPQ